MPSRKNLKLRTKCTYGKNKVKAITSQFGGREEALWIDRYSFWRASDFYLQNEK
ncbi:MAG: hypothetical protein Q7J15_10855 [Candidatus Desulfaltia sp.]|nr:hypothetical protein [Candidatus Desulfaltia sp.]